MGRRKHGKKAAAGPAPLACLAFDSCLLRCTVLGGSSSRRLVALWISKAEWEQLIRVVVVPCFKGSWQLVSLTWPAVDGDVLASVTGANCWLQWPVTVRSSTQSKRERELMTGCVLPASRSRMAVNFEEAAELAAPASRPADRHPKYTVNTDGYGYLDFDVYGVLAMEEERRGGWSLEEAAWSAKV